MKKDELEKVKSEYNKYIKIIKVLIIIFAIVASIILVKNLFKLGIAYKIVQNNVWMDLGDNYKITVYDEKTNEVTSTKYFKNDIVRIVDVFMNETTEHFITPDYIDYWLIPGEKEYAISSMPVEIVKIVYNHKANLFSPEAQVLSEFLQKKNSIEKIMKHKLYLEKYNEKQYIVSDLGYNKYYFDLSDFILRYKTNGNDMNRYEIEKGVVTDEEVTIPDLSTYRNLDEI